MALEFEIVTHQPLLLQTGNVEIISHVFML